jgi:2-polyprenyl-6-methoxyphenol hydroxylase-like FAD-dependent oxidoreductase
MLPWYRVRNGLLAKTRSKARSMPNNHILTTTKVVSISQEEDSSNVSIEALQTNTTDGSPPTAVSLQADFCVGADGLHSTVRIFCRRHPRFPATQSVGEAFWRMGLGYNSASPG